MAPTVTVYRAQLVSVLQVLHGKTGKTDTEALNAARTDVARLQNACEGSPLWRATAMEQPL